MHTLISLDLELDTTFYKSQTVPFETFKVPVLNFSSLKCRLLLELFAEFAGCTGSTADQSRSPTAAT